MSNILMFLLGFVLLGSTVLIPLFTQTLLGYTATQAGLVLSPGGVAIMLLMPLVGFLLGRYDARWMIALGLFIGAVGLYLMTHWDLQVDFKTVMLTRVVQASGLAFLFVPINTISYAFIPPEKNNNASGLINLARNIGGSVGISIAATFLARFGQHHQSILVAHVTPFDPQYRHALQNMTRTLTAQGYSPIEATQRALASIYQLVQRQANMLAYIDVFRMMGWCFLICIPLPFLMKKPKAHGPTMH